MAFGNHFWTAQLRHTGKCNPSYASMAPVVRNLWSVYTVAVKEIYQKAGYYVYYQLYCVYSSWLSHPAISWSWLWNWASEISFLSYFHEWRSISWWWGSICTSWLCIFLLLCSALEQSLHEIKEMDENFDLYPSDNSFYIWSAVRHNPILILLLNNSKILIISKVGFTVVIFSNTVWTCSPWQTITA